MGVGWTPAQRPAPPPLTVEARAFRAGGREALSALPVMLKLVTKWSGQHHLDCFKYYYSSAPRSVCSHIFEAGSRNCSSLCHGYSLVIMPLTSSTWWGFNLYKSAHRRRLRTGSMSHEEELKVLDYAQWWNHYYMVSFDCFPSFLHFLTSPIIFCLKFFHRPKAGWGLGWGRTIASCSVSDSVSTARSCRATHSS